MPTGVYIRSSPIVIECVGLESEIHLPECSDHRDGRTDALVFEVRPKNYFFAFFKVFFSKIWGGFLIVRLKKNPGKKELLKKICLDLSPQEDICGSMLCFLFFVSARFLHAINFSNFIPTLFLNIDLDTQVLPLPTSGAPMPSRWYENWWQRGRE